MSDIDWKGRANECQALLELYETLINRLLATVVTDGVMFTVDDDETFGDVVDVLLSFGSFEADHLSRGITTARGESSRKDVQ